MLCVMSVNCLVSGFLRNYPSVQALAAVRDESIQTVAPEAVQAQIRQRVAGFTAAAAEALHRAHAVVPQSVAAVLRAQPQLVAPAVEAFFYRDADDLKVCTLACPATPLPSGVRRHGSAGRISCCCELPAWHGRNTSRSSRSAVALQTRY